MRNKALLPSFTVSELTNYIKALLEGDRVLSRVIVKGEISNFKHHSSGHMYFTLKDANSSLRAVMFRSRAASVRFQPENGMQVVAEGSISLYPRDGQYQLYVESMQPDGVGTLYLAFEQLKKKLETEGLFDRERKKQLPAYPRVIGIATSPTGAAIRDMLTVIQRRYPRVKILVASVAVQGQEAPASIARALRLLNEQPDVEVIIVGRGGGSLEELWAFNDEQVARAIAASAKPVISAVGHETDFTIADMVADLRAPTPSAAAEAVVPVLAEVEQRLNELRFRLQLAQSNNLASCRQRLNSLAERRVFRSPAHLLENRQRELDGLEQRLRRASVMRVQQNRLEFQEVVGRLKALSPLAVLERGYSIALTREGKVVSKASQVEVGDELETRLMDGKIISRVIDRG